MVCNICYISNVSYTYTSIIVVREGPMQMVFDYYEVVVLFDFYYRCYYHRANVVVSTDFLSRLRAK